MDKKIGFIGVGKMATAVIKGLIKSNLFNNENIFVFDIDQEAVNKISNEFGLTTASSNNEVVKNSDIIILAVKPFVLKEVLQEIKDTTMNKLIISIVAGVSSKKIQEILGEKTRIIRIMPNTPALIGCGMSAICKTDYSTIDDIEITTKIFKSIGEIVEANESDIDAITGVSGSGPAFYYYIINEIAKAGEKMGLDYNVALKLSAQTALGAAKMILETNETPQTLIDNVTTPGGTTAEGNKVLLDSDLSKILFETVNKTTKKSELLGKQF